MKILVTGSSGTIGTRLCEKLLEQGHTVVGADWEPCKWSDTVESLRIDCDLRHEDAIEKLPTDADCVVHLAAHARVYELVEHPDRARDNMLSTFTVLEYMRQNNISRMLFASSREVYGNITAEKYEEDMAQIKQCESPYTASKIAGEALVESYQRCYGIDSIIFRFSNVYGMYDDSVRVVPLFIRQARANEPLTIFGKEKNLDFTYIDDCIDGIILGIDQFETAKNDTYNLAYGEGTTIIKLAEVIKQQLGSNSEMHISESRTGEVTNYIADITKAQSVLGYNPQVSFDEGIEKAIDWYTQESENEEVRKSERC